MSKHTAPLPDWEHVLSSAARLQLLYRGSCGSSWGVASIAGPAIARESRGASYRPTRVIKTISSRPTKITMPAIRRGAREKIHNAIHGDRMKDKTMIVFWMSSHMVFTRFRPGIRGGSRPPFGFGLSFPSIISLGHARITMLPIRRGASAKISMAMTSPKKKAKRRKIRSSLYTHGPGS